MSTNLGTTQRAALALGSATTLALLGLATPAHAAPGHHGNHGDHGDNRATSLKEGKGHNDKWQAQSDPDGQENGGVDQPGGAGGVDTSHQDGNNGSGNDVDCEDDNRGKGVPGHCKDKSKPSKPAEPSEPSEPSRPTEPSQPSGSSSKPGAEGTTGSKTEDTDVPAAGSGGPTGPAATPTVPVSTTRPSVLGIEQVSTQAGRAPVAASPADRDAVDRVSAVLPNTGAEAFTLALFTGGLASVVAGTVLLRRRQAEEV